MSKNMMNPEQRLALACQILGWQGGTVHQACAELGLGHNAYPEFLHEPEQDGAGLNSAFSAGWFCWRTCDRAWFFQQLAKQPQSDRLQFVLGALRGQQLRNAGV